MLYTLDTNAVSALINNSVSVLERWREIRLEGHAVKLNALSYFEVRRGLVLPQFARKFSAFRRLNQIHDLLPLDTRALDISADVYQDLRRQGALLEDADILIAGIALANDAVLVTRNLKHFERIDGLRLESWERGA